MRKDSLILPSLLVLGLVAILVVYVVQQVMADTPGRDNNQSVLFIENVGQFEEPTRYQVDSNGLRWWLTDQGVWLTAVDRAGNEGVHLQWQFEGAASQVAIEPLEKLETKVSYFAGTDPAGWHSDVPVWNGVRYVDIYPNIDLEVSSTDGYIVPRFVAKDGAELSMIQLTLNGAEEASVADNILTIQTAIGELTLPMFVSESELTLTINAPAGQTTTQLSDTPAFFPILSDTNLIYSTFVGGTDFDQGNKIVTDGSGFAYAIGEYLSIDSFPSAPGTFIPTHDIDSYVAKVNPAGTSIEFLTKVEAEFEEAANGIVVDPAGFIYVAGRTSSGDFPITPGAYSGYQGAGDAWVMKLNQTGTNIIYATIVGAVDREWALDLVVDGAGNAIFAGLSNSNAYPTTPGAHSDCASIGGWNAVVTKLNSTGTDLIYSTCLGSGLDDEAHAMALDNAGNVYVTGHTQDPIGFPGSTILGTIGGIQEVFVTKINPSGTGLVYSTVLAGGNAEDSYSILLDSSNRAYVAGLTTSSSFPVTSGAYDTSQNGGIDVFIARLNAGGSALDFATFLGGSGDEIALDVELDSANNIYFTGQSNSTNFPTTSDAYDTTANGNHDIILGKLNPTASTLLYGSYLGGSEDDIGRAMEIESDSVVFVTGLSFSTNFPISAGAYDSSHNGDADVVIAKLDFFEPPTPTPTNTNTPTITPTHTPGPSPTPTPTSPFTDSLPIIRHND